MSPALVVATALALLVLAGAVTIRRIRRTEARTLAAYGKQHAINAYEQWRALADRDICNGIAHTTRHVPQQRKETGQ